MLWDFHATRSLAVQEYARVETALHILLCKLLRLSEAMGAEIVYGIVNSSTRNKIIEKSIKENIYKIYLPFWFGVSDTNEKGLMSLVKALDAKRNEIVHWIVMHRVEVNVMEGSQAHRIHLEKQSLRFQPFTNSSGHLLQDLIEFRKMARFTHLATGMFTNMISQVSNQRVADAVWDEIFQRPCAYPPSKGHPFSERYQEIELLDRPA